MIYKKKLFGKHYAKTLYEWKNSFAQFSSGLFFEIQNNYSTPGTGVKRLIPDYIKFETGIYLLGNFQKINSFLCCLLYTSPSPRDS